MAVAFAARAAVNEYSYDDAGNLTGVVEVYVPPPVAAFALPATPKQRFALTFTDQSTTGQGSINRWLWDFGDGTTSTARNPVHTYVAAGSYAVVLEVTTNLGTHASTSKLLVVAEDQPPIASFVVAPLSPGMHDVVTYTDTSIASEGIAQVYWQIGFASLTGPVVQAVACASVDVTLTVFDHLGRSASITQFVAVTDGPPADVFVPAGGDLAATRALACPGDRLVVPAGVFAGGITLSDVSLIGAGAGSTVISGFGASTDGYVITALPSRGRTVTVEDATITGGGISGTGGGGVSVDGQGRTRLMGVEVSGNVGDGGVRVQPTAAGVEVHGSSLHHNTNDGPSWYGGGLGMYCCGEVTVTGSEIAYNSAPHTSGGGVGPFEADRLTFTGNRVHDNSAGKWGGGLYVGSYGAGDRVLGNRFTGNSAGAGTGGGVASIDGSVVFAGNLVAANNGGGVLDMASRSGLLIVSSTIADNSGPGIVPSSAATGNGTTVVNSVVSANGVDVTDLLADTSRANLIGPAASPFSSAGEYHLAADSMAIDMGDNAAVPPELTADLEGAPRFADGDGDGVAVVDLGCMEMRAAPVAAGTVEVDLSVGSGDGVVVSDRPGLTCDSSVSAACSASFALGAAVTFTARPAIGSHLVGWSGACTGDALTCQLTVGLAQSARAIFEPDSRPLTVGFYKGGGAGRVVSEPAGIDCDSYGSPQCFADLPFGVVVSLTATAAPGDYFLGWYGACQGAAPTCQVTLDAARGVGAVFERGLLTVSMEAGSGYGAISSDPPGVACATPDAFVCSTNDFPLGSVLTLTAAPDPGSHLVGWLDACGGSEPACQITLDAPKRAVAMLDEDAWPTLTVDVAGTGGGTVAGADRLVECTQDPASWCAISYPAGTTTTLTAVPHRGSHFEEWSGACEGTSPTCHLTVGSATMVHASFGANR
jgi:PKD repeat protein